MNKKFRWFLTLSSKNYAIWLIFERARAKMARIYYIGAAELPLRFPRCAPLLGWRYLTKVLKAFLYLTCSTFITKIHRVAFMNFAHVNFKNSNHFEFFGTFFTKSFMVAICIFWRFVEKIGIFQWFQTIFFRWYLSSLFCLVLFFIRYE